MAAPAYPPEEHVLRDLRFVTERDEGGSRSFLDVTPEIRGGDGSVLAGVLATLVDLAGGEGALRAVAPAWVATSDLVLHVTRPVSGGQVNAVPRVLRTTRRTAVLEVDLATEAGPAGFATMTFAVLEARPETDTQRMGTGAAEPRTEFGRPGSALPGPLPEALGVRELDPGAGVVELPVTPYVGNSLGALQGGVVAMALELGALALARERLGAAPVTFDLAVNYLRLLRKGPARTRARVLRQDADEVLVRAELLDAGDDDRLCSVGALLLKASS